MLYPDYCTLSYILLRLNSSFNTGSRTPPPSLRPVCCHYTNINIFLLNAATFTMNMKRTTLLQIAVFSLNNTSYFFKNLILLYRISYI